MDATPGGAVRRRPSRGDVIASGLMWASRWSLRFTIIVIGLYLLWYVMGLLWVIVLPVLLGIIIATVAWPPVAWMRKRGVPPAVAAALVMLIGLILVGLLMVLLAQSISNGIPEIAARASSGIASIHQWVTGPPLNLGAGGQFDEILSQITTRLQQSITVIVTGVASGVGVVASSVVTALLALVLAFLFVKDGPRFLPWLHGVVGSGPGVHFTALLGRIWATISGFVYTQAVVALIDSVLIGLGLVILDVPLALPLAVLTFLGGFVPIVGALVAGALAVLVALVSNGFTTALIVLAIILVVQQLEGNVLQPILQARSLSLHAAVVLLAVTAGGSLYGIGGAFLSVPVVAAAAVVLRYFGELIDQRTGDGPPPDTPDGPEPTEPGEITPSGRPVGTAGEQAEQEGAAQADVPPATN